MELRLHNDGRIDVQSVNELDESDLERWIRDRLHGRDTSVPGHPKQDVGQDYLVGAIYGNLAADTQKSVRRILTRFLRQMEEGSDEWQGPPGDALLLLTQDLDEDELVEPVFRMADDEQFLGEDGDEDRHARLLQTLTYLDEEATPDFWKRQVELNPSRFGVYAFAGMRMHSLYQAFGDILPLLDVSDETLRTQLELEIRGLLELDRGDVQDVIETLRDYSNLPDETYDLICEALPELSLEEPGDKSKSFGRAQSFLGEKKELQQDSLTPPEKETRRSPVPADLS